MKQKSIEEVEKTLGEPFVLDFSDYIRKIRSTLLAVCVVSIAIVLGGLSVDPGSSFLGLKFNGLTSELVFKALFGVTAYLFVHFLWCSVDSFQEWLLRVTGTRTAHVTVAVLASENGDYPTDPRQSTLYNWWKHEARKIGSLKEPLAKIEEKLDSWETTVKEALEGKDSNVTNSCMSIRSVAEDIAKLKKAVEQTEKSVQSQRIPVSLARFDRNYRIFLRSQNLRWLVVELGFPVLLAGFALILLWSKL